MKIPVSFVSTPSLTIRASLLSLSGNLTGDVMSNVDVDYTTGSFYPSYSIQPPTAGGLRYAGVGGAMCSYYHAYGGNKELEALWFSVHFPFDFSAI